MMTFLADFIRSEVASAELLVSSVLAAASLLCWGLVAGAEYLEEWRWSFSAHEN